jgi:circadian clock protein KaiC
MKAATGITGLDVATRGGLPRGRSTLIDGNAGSGKTVLALQNLVNGARQFGEPGIFVAFEENSRRIVANAESFGWDLPGLERDGLFFLDAQQDPNQIQNGGFDIGGLLAILDSKVKAMRAKRIVFDGIDVILALLNGPQAVKREVYRLHGWLLDQGLTVMITAKSIPGNNSGLSADLLELLQFMVDCSVSLSHDIVDGVSLRGLRIAKYRGSAFEENATPLVIGPTGMDVASVSNDEHDRAAITHERVSSGVDRLDTMLGGGYFRGAGILLTGSPGTAKTTLAGTFAEAACRRGEKTLYVSFDSFEDELIRNLTSVGIELASHVKSGTLHAVSARAISGSAEIHLMRIKDLAVRQGARCVVVDPISALLNSNSHAVAHSVAERLIDWAKETGITLLCTSLLDHTLPRLEGTPLQVSMIADTWIHLSYVVQAGERNRALSIVKSRGTEHSNQVRELILGAAGVTLADVYTANGDVLMGTLRWAKEREEQLAREERSTAADRRRLKLELEEAALAAEASVLQRRLNLKHVEIAHLATYEALAVKEVARAHVDILEKRGADNPLPEVLVPEAPILRGG